MLEETADYFKLLDRVSNAVKVMPRRAATLAVNFSKQRFSQSAWVDNSTEPWKKRSQKTWRTESRKRQGRAILVDSGHLRRSIRVIYVNDERAVIGTSLPYAQVHNDGFRGKVAQRVRKHVRKLKRGKEASVNGYSRTINQNTPRRRFIGVSAILNKQIERMMTAELLRAIKG